MKKLQMHMKKHVRRKVYNDMIERPYKGDANCAENILYKEFETKINAFVKSYLNRYVPCMYDRTKVIHDPVWGTCLFYGWELEILDSPLLQRLRNISQLGLTMLTYPTAHHSRFEHSLGVMSVITKMVNHINQDNAGPVISNEDFYTLRLAALLHDVGHCFCSHLSETIYGKQKEFVELKKSFQIFLTAKEHEIFAYIIINTKEFREFVKNKVHLWNGSIDVDKMLTDIGYMIVGASIPAKKLADGTYEKKYYLTQMINGQYDADKLDYLRRDSYTAGLALTYDIDRFLYKIRITSKDEIDNGKVIRGKHLVIPISGVSAVEEMAFSQLMLASYIYQHQKVLATDALMKDIVEGLVNNGKLQHPCDFLYYCDTDILGIASENPDSDFKTKISQESFDASTDKKISDIVRRLNHRDLPKRAFVVNCSTVINSPEQKQYPVSDIADRLKGISKLRNEIYDVAIKISNDLPKEKGGKKHIDLYDIYISIPKTSIAKDLSNALVLKNNGEFVDLSRIVRLSDWADAFAWHKWNAYVFSQADILPIVSIAAKIVFERYSIRFDEETVFSGIRNSDEIKELLEWLIDNNMLPS